MLIALACFCILPQVDMVKQVLLEHPAPPLDDIHQRVFEGSDVQLQPATKQPPVLHLAHSNIQRLKQVDLH